MKKNKYIKLYEEYNHRLDSILDELDVLGDYNYGKPNDKLYPFLKELLDNETNETNKIFHIIDFADDHIIVNINDKSSASEALKLVLKNDIDITFNNYLLLAEFYYKGISKNSIVVYIFENFIKDPNSDIVHDYLRKTTFSKYNDLFNYLVNRDGFDPSYNNSNLLSLAIDAEKIEYVKILLNDKRINPNIISSDLIGSLIDRNNIELVTLILKNKTEYDELDIKKMLLILVDNTYDFFKLIVDNIQLDLTTNNNYLLRTLIDFRSSERIKYLISKGDFMAKLDSNMMKVLMKNDYLPTYKKRKITRD